MSNVYKRGKTCAKLGSEVNHMLDISLEFRKGILFVRLMGELTKDTIYKLERDVTTLILEQGIHNVVFNVSGLSTIDLKGIHGLFHSYEMTHQNQGKSMLCGLESGEVKERIKRSRLLQYMCETNDELSAFSIIE